MLMANWGHRQGGGEQQQPSCCSRDDGVDGDHQMVDGRSPSLWHGTSAASFVPRGMVVECFPLVTLAVGIDIVSSCAIVVLAVVLPQVQHQHQRTKNRRKTMKSTTADEIKMASWAQAIVPQSSVVARWQQPNSSSNHHLSWSSRRPVHRRHPRRRPRPRAHPAAPSSTR